MCLYLLSLSLSLVAMCRTLEVEDGVVILSNDTRPEGTVAYYDCIENFELRGTNNRTCQGNGEWSGNNPTCEGTKYIKTFFYLGPYLIGRLSSLGRSEL